MLHQERAEGEGGVGVPEHLQPPHDQSPPFCVVHFFLMSFVFIFVEFFGSTALIKENKIAINRI